MICPISDEAGCEVAIFPALEAADTLVADIRASFRSIERPGVEAA
jgi:hypothetical protein